ncbi:stress responsive A/B barrel domain-containing protein [Karstenula rhodostoma CBS 690.94]|uniref:Stress responsive A/B barrel domain-containing protein n=1 Tax=Karstenula rhodostoma CBS 690.94 TaxID=1392251 RepID=A0A9P4PDD0_9PLEO|nr:stress responsive A/B barrel domain-containing protein [Karstenula rhodostoma CBS 690.94]
MATTNPITRVTLFKIPSSSDAETLLSHFRGMPTNALKDGNPYLLSVTAGPTFEDPRSQGFNFAAISKFKNKEDMVYYDEECAAHAALKAFAKDVIQGIMMVYLEDGAAE